MTPDIASALGAHWRAWRASQQVHLEEGLDLLAAADEAAHHTGQMGLAAASDDRDGPPVLRLLLVPAWGDFLAPAEGLVFLQGFDDDLYVRIQGVEGVDRVALTVRTGRAEERVDAERVVTGDFGLPVLNGGGEAGSLWFLRDAQASALLGPKAVELTLVVGRRGEELVAEPITVPALSGRVRVGFDAVDGAEPEGRRRVREAVAAYRTADASGFAVALQRLVSDRRGAAAHEDGWRRLSRWHALWVRAMCAELRRMGKPARAAWGLAFAEQHPQLGIPAGG